MGPQALALFEVFVVLIAIGVGDRHLESAVAFDAQAVTGVASKLRSIFQDTRHGVVFLFVVFKA